MNRIIQLFSLLLSLSANSQSFFSKVYSVPEDGTGQLNVWPNYLTALFPTDSLIYAFGYSADTTYPEIYGTAFYTFNWEGNLLDYYHIKDDEQNNFFFPEGIHTWDGITFYTGYNHHNRFQSILKFNRISRKQDVLQITNIVDKNKSILRSNLVGTNDGYLVTSSKISIDSTGTNYKIQVTKIDTNGAIKWQNILGNDPGNGFQNNCYAAYSDTYNSIYIGVGFDDALDLGWKAVYQSLLYKLEPTEGKQILKYSSKQDFQGYGNIYDIVQDDNKWLYLLSSYNYNFSKYPYFTQGFSSVQILDSLMKFKKSVDLDFRDSGGNATGELTKIIQANKKKGFIIGGSISINKDTFCRFIDTVERFDTIRKFHFLLNLIKIDTLQKIEWRKIYRIRSGKDDGYLYDIKSCPTGGYIIAAASYLDDAFEKYGQPYYMPWLLRVDDDGCLIPGCGAVGTNNSESKDKEQILVYPNLATNYIVIVHPGSEKTHYQIVFAEGKIIDDFSSNIQGEQIIIPVYNYKAGYYFVKAENKKRRSSKLFIKK